MLGYNTFPFLLSRPWLRYVHYFQPPNWCYYLQSQLRSYQLLQFYLIWLLCIHLTLQVHWPAHSHWIILAFPTVCLWLITRQELCFHRVCIIVGTLTSKQAVMVLCDKLPSHRHRESIPNWFGPFEAMEITPWPLNYIAYFYLFT